VYPPKGSSYKAEDNVIIGNVALYGATRGRAYFRGMAAERFCVRNSGAYVVVEGVGDHGCEYMTGGRAVILGPTGRNFAAGMSGGIAYVWDRDKSLTRKLNPEMVEACEMEHEDISSVKTLLDEHWRFTGSSLAEQLLSAWEEYESEFVKIIPPAFRQVLELQQLRDKELVNG
jgi:glutamate synthase (NADPH) large chain